MAGKAPAAGFRVFPNRGQIKIQEKGVIEFSGWLRGKKSDVVDDFLATDNNQSLSDEFVLST